MVWADPFLQLSWDMSCLNTFSRLRRHGTKGPSTRPSMYILTQGHTSCAGHIEKVYSNGTHYVLRNCSIAEMNTWIVPLRGWWRGISLVWVKEFIPEALDRHPQKNLNLVAENFEEWDTTLILILRMTFIWLPFWPSSSVAEFLTIPPPLYV